MREAFSVRTCLRLGFILLHSLPKNFVISGNDRLGYSLLTCSRREFKNRTYLKVKINKLIVS